MKMFSWTTAIILSLLLLLIATTQSCKFALKWLIVIWKASLFKSLQWQCTEIVNQCVRSLQQNGFIGKYDLLDILIFPDVIKVSFIHQAKKTGIYKWLWSWQVILKLFTRIKSQNNSESVLSLNISPYILNLWKFQEKPFLWVKCSKHNSLFTSGAFF